MLGVEFVADFNGSEFGFKVGDREGSDRLVACGQVVDEGLVFGGNVRYEGGLVEVRDLDVPWLIGVLERGCEFGDDVAESLGVLSHGRVSLADLLEIDEGLGAAVGGGLCKCEVEEVVIGYYVGLCEDAWE